MTFLRELRLLLEARDAFYMGAHVAHDQIAILLDLRARGRDLAPGIVDVSEEIPEHVKAGALRENKVRMRQGRALDSSLLQRQKAVTVGTDLQEREILVRVRAPSVWRDT